MTNRIELVRNRSFELIENMRLYQIDIDFVDSKQFITTNIDVYEMQLDGTTFSTKIGVNNVI